MSAQWIQPDWPAPANVRALITTRAGGVSRGLYGVPPHDRDGMNIGLGSGDNLADVAANRARLRTSLPADPRWLHQVHGAVVVDAGQDDSNAIADASFTDEANVVCAVSIADCMPVLLADVVGSRCRCRARWMARSCGWRDSGNGEVNAREASRIPSAELLAYLGPAIGPRHFEVGAEVLDAMQARLPEAEPRVHSAAEWQVLGRSVRTRTSGA